MGRMGRVSWTEKKSNKEVLGMLEVERQLLNIVKKRKLNYFGHIKRHETIQRNTLEGKVEGKRARGRQRLKWEDSIKGWTKSSMKECDSLAGQTVEECVTPETPETCKKKTKSQIVPGFSVKEHFQALKLKTQSMKEDKDKAVSLVFDEMAIKEHLQYGTLGDTIEGFEDFGQLGKSKYIANHALVFMIRGLCRKWKQPIAYFLTSGVIPKDKLCILLNTCIDKVNDTGLIHAQELINHGFKVKWAPIRWDYVKQVHFLDEQSPRNYHLAPGLTDKHINLTPFAKMRVPLGLAAQVFSHSVAVAMHTFIFMHKSTVDFIESDEEEIENMVCAFDEYYNDNNDVLQKLNTTQPKERDTYTVNGQTMSITDAAIIRKYDLMDHVPLQDDHEYADSPTITSISEFKKASISYISGYVVKMAEKENQMHGLLSNTETGKHTEEASFLKFKDRGGQNESFTETLLALTNEPELLTIDSLHMQSLERFVVIMYSKGCGLAKVNEARHRLFTSVNGGGKRKTMASGYLSEQHLKTPLKRVPSFCIADVYDPVQGTVHAAELVSTAQGYVNVKVDALTMMMRWKQVQYLTNLFWRRWLNEYLLLLQRRQKWVARQENLKIGDIVLMADNRLPRGQWPLGRVIEVYPDKGADVRTLKVKSKLGIMDRPVSKLVNLESHL
ncbi:hypothetical protein GQR58_015022 [Nymphon striatum]|nr:hypothetical protein GQR58_015022 [Nymphon striatum]